jgi:hypothetical protein
VGIGLLFLGRPIFSLRKRLLGDGKIIMPKLATYLFSAKGAVFILAWGNAPGISAIPIPALKARFIPMP